MYPFLFFSSRFGIANTLANVSIRRSSFCVSFPIWSCGARVLDFFDPHLSLSLSPTIDVAVWLYLQFSKCVRVHHKRETSTMLRSCVASSIVCAAVAEYKKNSQHTRKMAEGWLLSTSIQLSFLSLFSQRNFSFVSEFSFAFSLLLIYWGHRKVINFFFGWSSHPLFSVYFLCSCSISNHKHISNFFFVPDTLSSLERFGAIFSRCSIRHQAIAQMRNSFHFSNWTNQLNFQFLNRIHCAERKNRILNWKMKM